MGAFPELADCRKLLFDREDPSIAGVYVELTMLVVELGRLGLRHTRCATRGYEFFAGGIGDPVS